MTVAVSGLVIAGAVTEALVGVKLTVAPAEPPANQCEAASRIFEVAPPIKVTETGVVPRNDTGTVQVVPDPVTTPTVVPGPVIKSSALTPVTASLRTSVRLAGEVE